LPGTLSSLARLCSATGGMDNGWATSGLDGSRPENLAARVRGRASDVASRVGHRPGGARGEREARRMVDEKLAANATFLLALATGGAGSSPRSGRAQGAAPLRRQACAPTVAACGADGELIPSARAAAAAWRGARRRIRRRCGRTPSA
jgi:hypothetical protein